MVRQHALALMVALLSVSSASAQETGADLGAPPIEGQPLDSVDSAVIAPNPDRAPTQVPNTPVVQPSNDPIPPPPQSGYTVPSGYGNTPPPRFVPTQTRFQTSVAPRRPVRVRVREGTQIPADARVFERRSRFLLLPGVIAFAVSYAISVAAGVIDEDRLLYTPLIGPLLWQLDEGTSDTAALMALLSIAQTAGAVLFTFGMRKKKYAEWYAGGRRISLAAAPSRRGAALTLNVW